MSRDSTPERPSSAYESLKQRRELNREFDASASWRDWLRNRYLKYWYGLGSLILDGMVVAVVLQSTDPSQVWPYVVSVALVVGLLYGEVRGYMHFWRPKSPP